MSATYYENSAEGRIACGIVGWPSSVPTYDTSAVIAVAMGLAEREGAVIVGSSELVPSVMMGWLWG